MSVCPYTVLDICFARAPSETGSPIFGFSEFLTALALIVLVFNSSDFLYQFRISVAPLPLRAISFGAAAAIGLGTLLTDLWFAERWYSPAWGVSRAVIQGMFGALFLTTVLLWIWFAFMRPPIFGRANYKRFYGALLATIVRGSDSQLAALAGELRRSAEAFVRLCSFTARAGEGDPPQTIGNYAHYSMLLLGNRKLCRHVVASSPVTAIALMQVAAERKQYSAPLGGFTRNITEESLRNRDSILFHENAYGSDVLRTVQPFRTAMYGNYRLVEGISEGANGPLDIDWKLAWEMDGEQFEAYCKITLLTFEDYIRTGCYRGQHSYALHRAFDVIGGAGNELYKFNGQPGEASGSTPCKRLSAAAQFVDDAINFLGKQQNLVFGYLKCHDLDHRPRTIFDRLAELMFELIWQASSIKHPIDDAWWVQYNVVWSKVFTFRETSAAWNVIRFKINRLIYDEIKRLETFPNYKGSRILGFCLNVLGLEVPSHATRKEWDSYALKKAVLSWTKSHYMDLREAHPPVAESVLIGGISFDSDRERLVKTYSQGLSLQPSRRYFELNPPTI